MHFAALPLAEAPTWDEAFITSTNRRIMPIRRIDDVDSAGNAQALSHAN